MLHLARNWWWCFLLLCLGLTACQRRPADVDFIFINGAEPPTLDPHLVTGQPEMRLCNALFEGLTRRNARGEAVPGVAESWTVSEDGTRYTFYLRQNARWSDGTLVTASDFERSWLRALAPATGSRYAEILFFIRNAEAFNKGKITDASQVGVKAVDPFTLQVELESPTPFFIDVVAFTTYLPVPMHQIARHGEQWIKPEHMVSNGAYSLESWRINDRVRLKKNPHYWNQESVAFKRIDALSMTKASTAFNLFATGQADLILDKGLVPAMLIGELRRQPYFQSAPILATYFYRFNVTKPPFDDVRVRQAFALTLDRKRIVERITKAGEIPTQALTPPGIGNYQPPQGLDANVEKARRLLLEAGFPEGKGFPRVTILYNKTELNEQIATEIQAMWKSELGVNVELRNQEWATYLRSLDNLDYDIARSSWVGDYNDPNTFLDCFVSGRGNNRTGWSHAGYDALMAQANRTLEPARRYALLQQAEHILVEQELPIVPIYHFVNIMIYHPERLRGIEANTIDEHPLSEMYWKP